MELNGVSALVTGATSALGRATAFALAAGGAKVVVTDTDPLQGGAIATLVGGRYVHADVTSTEDLLAAIDIAGSAAPLRVAVNCAGVAHGRRVIGHRGQPHDLGVFQRVVAINLTGTFNVLRLCAAAMMAADPIDGGERGVIVNAATDDGPAGGTAYAAANAGIIGLTQPAARDLEPYGIRVATVTLDANHGWARWETSIPPRRNLPDKFAEIVIDTIRDHNINGETLRIDGGLSTPHCAQTFRHEMMWAD